MLMIDSIHRLVSGVLEGADQAETSGRISAAVNENSVEDSTAFGSPALAENLFAGSANFSARSLVGAIFANDGAKSSPVVSRETVQDVASSAELKKVIAENPNKMVVVFFSLPSCKPCEEAYPRFAEQAEALTLTDDDIVFVYCSNSDVPYEVMSWDSVKNIGFPFVTGFKSGRYEIFYNLGDIEGEAGSFGLPIEAKVGNYANKLNSNLPEIKIKGIEALAMFYLGASGSEAFLKAPGEDYVRAVFAARGLALGDDEKIAKRASDVYPILLRAVGAEGIEREFAVIVDVLMKGSSEQKGPALELLAKIVKASAKCPDGDLIEKIFLFLANSDPVVRKNGAQVIGALVAKPDFPKNHLPAVRKELLLLLGDSNEEVASVAARELKFFGIEPYDAEDIVDGLMKLLDSQSDLAKAGAVESLGVYFVALTDDDKNDLIACVLRSAMSGNETLRAAAAKLLKSAAIVLSNEEVQKILPVISAKLKYDGPNFEENAQIRYATLNALLAIVPKCDDRQKRFLQGVVAEVARNDNYRWSRELAQKILEKIK